MRFIFKNNMLFMALILVISMIGCDGTHHNKWLPFPIAGGTTTATVDPGPAGAAPDLGTASTYGIIAFDGITSSAAFSHIYGDVALTSPTGTIASVSGSGLSDAGSVPAKSSSMVTTSDGVNPGLVASADNGNMAALPQLRLDLLAAFNANKLGSPTRVAPAAVPTPTGNGGTFAPGVIDLGGRVLRPGIYAVGAAANTYSISGTNGPLVLDARGNAGAVWVFQAHDLSTSDGSVVLFNGAQAKNVFWVLTATATIGSSASTFFQGTIVAGGTITLTHAGNNVEGRMLAGAAGAGSITISNPTTITVPLP